MVNAVLDAILNYIDNTIVKCEGSDFLSTRYAETMQNFRYCYFGSKLVVDNSENLNSPDALNIDEDYNLEFLRNRMPVIPIDLIKQGVDE